MRASKKVKGAVLLTAGAALFVGAPTVYAGSTGGDGGNGGNGCSVGGNTSSGNDGILGGAQLLNNVNLNIPVTVGGLAILGGSAAKTNTTAGNCDGGNGGNGGKAKSSGEGSAKGGSGGNGGNAGSKGSNTTRGNDGILNGLQVGNNLTANVPVTVCGVGALLARAKGDCTTNAGNTGGGNGGNGGNAKASGEGSAKGGSGGDGGNAGSKGSNRSVDNDGILGGAQLLNNADLNVPVTLCGVAVLVASAGCSADVDAGNKSGGDGGNGGNAKGSGDGWAKGGNGGNGGNAGVTGDNVSAGNDGILGGLQALNNLNANVPVTVCGLALLGRAGCTATVTAGNMGGGDGGDGGDAVVRTDDDGHGVKAVHTHKHHTIHVVESALPHTGAAGLALIPFGAALVAGGVALRRRSSVQR